MHSRQRHFKESLETKTKNTQREQQRQMNTSTQDKTLKAMRGNLRLTSCKKAKQSQEQYNTYHWITFSECMHDS